MLNGKKGKKGALQGKSGAHTRRKATIAPKRGSSSVFWEILGRFDQALSLLVVTHRSLAAKELVDVGDEEEALQQGIQLMKEVHRELDRRALRFGTGQPRAKRKPLNALKK
jgi:hypothetical protein